MRTPSPRRRPVPHEWVEDWHYLTVQTQRGYHVRGGGYTSRAGGRCACGAVFGKSADKHNMNAADVRDDWKDHVEDAFYKPEKVVLRITRPGDRRAAR